MHPLGGQVLEKQELFLALGTWFFIGSLVHNKQRSYGIFVCEARLTYRID